MNLNKVIIGIILCSISVLASVDLNMCKSCHGLNFEKKALGMSLIVKNLTQKEVSDALIGYKNRTYGSVMKGIMNSQVRRYNKEELKNTGIGIKEKTWFQKLKLSKILKNLF